jgi:transposase
LGLYFELFDHNVTAYESESFVAELLQHFPRGIILVWDRWMVHRSAGRRLRERFLRRVQVELLPAYAPDLNPVEQVWRHTKHVDLPNYLPSDADDLGQAVKGALERTADQKICCVRSLNIQS